LQDVTCANCHSIHGKERNPVVAPYTTASGPTRPTFCGTCHQQIRRGDHEAVAPPDHREQDEVLGLPQPARGAVPVMLRHESVNAQCTSCHADKRGPFVFPHPPVEENCLSCHNPHGSVHYKLTTEHVPNLCQDCHDWSRHPDRSIRGQSGWLTPGGTPKREPQHAADRAVLRQLPQRRARLQRAGQPRQVPHALGGSVKRKTLATLVGSLCVAGAAGAQTVNPWLIESSVTAGAIVNDESGRDTSQIQKYQDLNNGVLSNILFRGRNDKLWIDAYGENFGRDDMYLSLRGGQYDRFKYRVYSNWLPHNFAFGARTPYNGVGSNLQVGTFPTPNPDSWNQFDLGYQRKDTGGHFEWQG
jgi:predicted CXXCH cytochrome family protein